MSKKNKYGNVDQEDLLRYLHGEMSDEERHALEREVQKDLFTSEALEGLSTQRIEQVREDLDRLEDRLRKRVKSKQSVIWMRIAASIAIILTIGTLYFTVFTDMIGRTDRMAAETESKEELGDENNGEMPAIPLKTAPEEIREEDVSLSRQTENIREPQAVPAAAEQAVRDEKVRIQEETILTDAATKPADNVAPARADTVVFMAMDAESEAGPVLVVEEPEEQVFEELTAERASEPPAAQTRARSTDIAQSQAKKQASAVSGPELPLAVILSDSVSARPVGGMDAFREFIDNNIKIPEGEAGTTGTEVILSFRIGTSGRPEDIEVLETAGESFSLEAARLLQEGPDWIPAGINGMPIRGKTRLRINFPNR